MKRKREEEREAFEEEKPNKRRRIDAFETDSPHNVIKATAHGSVVAFGSNDVNMLGLPLPDLPEEENEDNSERFLRGSDPKPDLLTTRTLPTRVPGVTRVCSISAGGMHTAALTVDGKVYTWGVADEGALGYSPDDDENPTPQIVPIPDKIIQVRLENRSLCFSTRKDKY
jgi:regulator of chromosome condensation